MSEIVILALIRIHEFDLPIIADYYFEVGDRLSRVKGSQGLSVWRDERDTEAFLVCYDYADLAAAERGLVAVSEIRILAETQNADFRPADVIRVRVAQHTANRLSAAPATSSLSMSVRVADPGYGPELVDQVTQIFEELQFFPGFLGSLCGPNDALEEEVIGLVTWENRESFIKSLPPGTTMSKLKVYGRFF